MHSKLLDGCFQGILMGRDTSLYGISTNMKQVQIRYLFYYSSEQLGSNCFEVIIDRMKKP